MSHVKSGLRLLLLGLLALGGAALLFKPDPAYSVSASFPKTDDVLLAQIQTKIVADPILSSSKFHLEAVNGAVSISGMVPKVAQAIEVIILVESVAGVQSVDVSGLSIQTGSLTADELINSLVIGTFNREGLMGPLSQQPIVTNKTGVGQATFYTPAPPISLQVKTRDSVVYLSGSAPSQDMADKAVDLARSISGVTDVKSTIRVSQ